MFFPTATGLVQLVERLTAEKVTGSIPGTKSILRVLKNREEIG